MISGKPFASRKGPTVRVAFQHDSRTDSALAERIFVLKTVGVASVVVPSSSTYCNRNLFLAEFMAFSLPTAFSRTTRASALSTM